MGTSLIPYLAWSKQTFSEISDQVSHIKLVTEYSPLLLYPQKSFPRVLKEAIVVPRGV